MTTITVVVPTYNRAADLERCLTALHGQTLAPELFEVIVVDDGSSDSTSALLVSWAAQWGRLRFYRQTNAGPATARNMGIVNARCSVVAFTDDDCVPPTDWVHRIHDRFSSGVEGCLHGAIHSTLPSTTFVHSVVADGAVITSNLAVERSVFDRIGVFDTRFRAPWCEDADLYYRLRKAEIPITYDRDLIVNHPPRYQAFWNSLKKSRFFQYYGLIAKKHPDMEPLRLHRDRVVLGVKKLVVLGFTAVVVARLLSVPLALGLLISPSVFWILDGYRLRRIKAELSARGIHVLPKDQLLYVFLNWTSNIAESYYLLKGALIYR